MFNFNIKLLEKLKNIMNILIYKFLLASANLLFCKKLIKVKKNRLNLFEGLLSPVLTICFFFKIN